MPAMDDSSAHGGLLARYRPWRRAVEIAFWIAFFALHAAVNTEVSWLDITRAHLPFQRWEAATWEWSSNLVILALMPIVVIFEREVPLRAGTFRRNLPWHFLASIVFSLAHVGTMVGVRKAIYAAAGLRYDFGYLPTELAYEYLKDGRTYALILVIMAGYRLFLLRLQGEARLLAAPDTGPAVEPVERPERFLVRKLGKEFLLPAADIEWLQARGNYVNLRVRERDYPLRGTLAAIEQRLDPAVFVRVHPGYIVNVRQVAEIEPTDDGDARLKMRDGTTVPCSRRYRDRLGGSA
jgi:DNA-binding LytR/AlgR family response regulator